MSLPSGTVTFLFTDIEGSTRLAQEHRDQWEALRSRHHAILRSAIEGHDVDVCQIVGNAFFVAFGTAADTPRPAPRPFVAGAFLQLAFHFRGVYADVPADMDAADVGAPDEFAGEGAVEMEHARHLLGHEPGFFDHAAAPEAPPRAVG